MKYYIYAILGSMLILTGLGQYVSVFAKTTTHPIAKVQRQGDRVVLHVITGCPNCEEAEQILSSHGIRYSIVNDDNSGAGGFFPKLYVNGKYYGTGSQAAERYADSR